MANTKKPLTPLARRIQKIVDDNGILKKDFAASIGVHPNYIYQIISGNRTTVSEPLAKLIETLYDCPPGWVLHGSRRHRQSRKESEKQE